MLADYYLPYVGYMQQVGLVVVGRLLLWQQMTLLL